MIDTFLGLGDTGHYGFCHRMRHAVIILFFFLKVRSSLQYFITQGMGQSSMFLTFPLYVILGGGLRLWIGWEEGKEESQDGSIPVYYEAFLKTHPAHKHLITRRGYFHLRGWFFFQLTISPSDLLALILVLIQDCKKYSKATIHHDEKHDFFFHLIQCLSA